jgi:hypothetical protein
MTPSEISKKEWLLRNSLENLLGDIVLLERGKAISVSAIQGTLKVNIEVCKLNLCVATVAQAIQFIRLLERARGVMPHSMIPKDL